MKKKKYVNREFVLFWAVLLVFFIVFVGIIALGAYAPYREKEVFNKFRDPNTPEATYIDALFSNLRVTTK